MKKLDESTKETQELIELWRAEAREMTLEKLPEFLERITTQYEHDYGTICHAISIGGIAAMWAVNHSEQGGITGFQAGAITWENIMNWNSSYKGKPLKLIDYSRMIYPQHEEEFDKTITPETWEFLEKEAKFLLKEHSEEHTNKDVVSHWQKIVSGIVPFGYAVKV